MRFGITDILLLSVAEVSADPWRWVRLHDLCDLRFINHDERGSAAFSGGAYDYFDLLRQHTGDSQFDDALRDLEALGQLTGGAYDTLRSALQNGDRTTAIQYENTMVPDFLHLCNESNTVAIRLHILRVGSDGPSSDIVVREWNYTDSKVYAPTPGDPYDFTRVQSAPEVLVHDQRPMITNADTGAAVSWKVDYYHYCPVATHAGCVSDVDRKTEYHLTTTAGGSVASDVLWDVPGPVFPGQQPIAPALQLEDGSFVGSVETQAGSSMLAFDSSGNIRWTVPNYFPGMATADGGIIGSLVRSFDWSTGTFTGATFGANGAATAQVVLQTYYSWKGSYSLAVGSSVQSVAALFPHLLPLYGAVSTGNLSGNGTGAVHRTIGLFWCGEMFSGTCAGEYDKDNPPHPLEDLGFYYRYALHESNPPSYDFTADHYDWDIKIMSLASNAARAAFKTFPASIVRWGKQNSWFQKWLMGQGTYQQDLVALISANNIVDLIGLAPENLKPPFWIYYGTAMNGAQFLPDPITDELPHDAQSMTEDQARVFQVLLERIGNGIGNSVAHEIGHMLSLPNIHCGIQGNPPCGPDNSPYYESSESFSAPPLRWTPQDAEELQKKLLKPREPR